MEIHSGRSDRLKLQTPLKAKYPLVPTLDERLRRFELFSNFSEPELRNVAASARIRDCLAGEYLWYQNEPNTHVLFIEEGLAITSRHVRDNVYRTYGIYGPGDSMGLYAMWAGMCYPTDALVMNEGGLVIQVEAKILADLAIADSRITSAMLAEISRFTEAILTKVDVVSSGKVVLRIAKLMSMLIDRYAVSMPDGTWYLPFRMTLEQIGRIVDSRFETVARVLSQWKQAGWLTVNENGLCFSNLECLSELLAKD